MKPSPDDFYEWQEGNIGGIRRPDAPRYVEAPKPKVGRPRKAPEGEGYDVRARLTVEAIAALKVLMGRGLTRTDAVNLALVKCAQPEPPPPRDAAEPSESAKGL